MPQILEVIDAKHEFSLSDLDLSSLTVVSMLHHTATPDEATMGASSCCSCVWTDPH
ncbi:hypothetical protein [Streptacidiphilus sp. EB129]|jgi:hypothetical protein|uniref:hypothetical protein n=1 Tax=Streptacidiphilus sp. EB129 TaxID=3156262 RepID=UPI003512FD7B